MPDPNLTAGRSDLDAYTRMAAASAIAPTLAGPAAGVPSSSQALATQSPDPERAPLSYVISIYRLNYEHLSLVRTTATLAGSGASESVAIVDPTVGITTTPPGSGVSEPHRDDREFSKALAFVSTMLSRSSNWGGDRAKGCEFLGRS